MEIVGYEVNEAGSPLALDNGWFTYCYKHGWNWEENGVDLYQILDRVSCWCCTNKNQKEIKNIMIYLPEYWERIKEYERKCGVPYKKKGYQYFEEKLGENNDNARNTK